MDTDMENYHFDLFADYFQFYICDEAYNGVPQLDWSEQCIEDMLGIVPGLIQIGTARNMTVPVDVEVRDSEPEEDFNRWDHIAEAGIVISSGAMIIAGLMDDPDEAARIEIKPGSYRARVCYGDLDILSTDGLEGDDHYKVALWPGEFTGVKVIKRRIVA